MSPATALIERQALALQVAAGPDGFARRHGEPDQAGLVLLGWPGAAGDPCLPSARSTGSGSGQRAVLLYLTDRCPVGCAHCSVSALPRGRRAPTPRCSTGWWTGCAGSSRIRLVGISGGEPFGERRTLDRVTARLAAAGKQLVLYTSGNWGRDDGTAPAWTAAVLGRAACVVLSTDSYHAARLPDARYVAALRATASAGSWIAVQVIGSDEETAASGTAAGRRAGLLLAGSRGNPPYPDAGAAAGGPGPRPAPPEWPGRSFGACGLARSPVVRFDGRVTACCNEDVVTGHGPAALHATARCRRNCTRSSPRWMTTVTWRPSPGPGPARSSGCPGTASSASDPTPTSARCAGPCSAAGADRDPAVRVIGLAAAG